MQPVTDQNQGPAPRPLPPANATPDELYKLAKWDTTPLLMNKLPDQAVIDPEAKASIDALQSLIYDRDDVEESVKNLKDRANELFKFGDYRQALGFYHQALDLITSAIQTGGGSQSSSPVPELVFKTLLSNRAACHLALENYRACITDCEEVTKAPIPSPSPGPVRKAFFRSAKARMALKDMDSALETLQTLITLDRRAGSSEDPDVAKLVEEIHTQIKMKADRADRLEKKARDERVLNNTLRSVLMGRGIIVPHEKHFPPPPDSLPPGLKPAHFTVLEDESYSIRSITYPVYIYRPEDDPPSRDLVLKWEEDDLFGDHLREIVGDQEYQLYIITLKRRIIKCGNQLTIRQVAQHVKGVDGDGIELGEHGNLEMYLLPKGTKEQDWIRETKATRGT
ncbi:hypothetical protein CROQUDRAFT_55879 [Cronartium quercuum f. sp. fusiforme G11]|uniref:Cns1/TTC4 wheel domain-containing protein n=1 Tax=Cronartium quercuum f. sp. fusiforme G11 TaxID=708437 RepID=A0A9P6TI89_9BASI|nr:hypothetical protein CROQUDRAFT_55879 [Cronartium quercuum f. sp. fusiforme G11]